MPFWILRNNSNSITQLIKTCELLQAMSFARWNKNIKQWNPRPVTQSAEEKCKAKKQLTLAEIRQELKAVSKKPSLNKRSKAKQERRLKRKNIKIKKDAHTIIGEKGSIHLPTLSCCPGLDNLKKQRHARWIKSSAKLSGLSRRERKAKRKLEKERAKAEKAEKKHNKSADSNQVKKN